MFSFCYPCEAKSIFIAPQNLNPKLQGIRHVGPLRASGWFNASLERADQAFTGICSSVPIGKLEGFRFRVLMFRVVGFSGFVLRPRPGGLRQHCQAPSCRKQDGAFS